MEVLPAVSVSLEAYSPQNAYAPEYILESPTAVPQNPYGTETETGVVSDVDFFMNPFLVPILEYFLSTSGTNVVAIDNKIEQAMDLVKSHLMYAVREEVEVLKEKIEGLEKKIFRLEWENGILRETAPPETLARIAAGYTGPAVAAATTVASSAPSTLPQGTVLNPPQLQQHLPPIVPPATGASVPTPSPNTGALPPEK